MRKPIREDDEQLAQEWPIAPPAPVVLPLSDEDPVVLLLASTRRRGAFLVALGVVAIAFAVVAVAELPGPFAFLAALFAAYGVLDIVAAWPLLRSPHGQLLVDRAHVELRHPLLHEPVSFPIGVVHSAVEGPVEVFAPGLRQAAPADHVGALPVSTHWVATLGTATRRPPDLLLVVVPAPVARLRPSSGFDAFAKPRPVRGFALHLHEPGMDDVVLPEVFGHKLVDRLAADAWAYLVQEDRRFTEDPVSWVRTRVR